MMLVPKCIYPKCIFAKCTRLACLLSFASLFKWRVDLITPLINGKLFKVPTMTGFKINLSRGPYSSYFGHDDDVDDDDDDDDGDDGDDVDDDDDD